MDDGFRRADNSSRLVAAACSVEIAAHKFLFFCFILPINALLIPFYVSYLCLTVTANVISDLSLRSGIRLSTLPPDQHQADLAMLAAAILQVSAVLLAWFQMRRLQGAKHPPDRFYEEIQGEEGGNFTTKYSGSHYRLLVP